jgi:GNAT superfamily N-acetyltransferase
MLVREATEADIQQMQLVRNVVKENTLSNPALVSDEAVREYITQRGKGWVCEIDNVITGFSIVDLKENNIWALFVRPEYEKRGIGKRLHDIMLAWYFNQTNKTVWLGTAPNTRAEKFYRLQGWTEVGMLGAKEIKFEMTIDWLNRK